MINFALQKGRSDFETKTLNVYQMQNPDKIKLHYFNKPTDVPVDYIPCGVIDWCTGILGYVPIPNYYPMWLQHNLYRKVWITDKWPITKDIFIKPYDKPKRFKATITTGTYRGKKKSNRYWCSEKVQFINEWRYYVVNGKIIFANWYDGLNDEDIIPPEFGQSIIIPKVWCGCIDMGILSTGEFALVECGEPYSIGWYGRYSDAHHYVEFLIEGWKYLLKLKNNHF
jgi:hypothetical protein